VAHFFAGLEPAAGARPASTERERALLMLARDVIRLPGRGHQKALCLLARALADAQIE
jgi:hypothetical protein